MGNGRCQLAHGRHAISVGQFRLYLAISALAFAHLLFGLFAFAQVKHEGHALLLTGFECGQTDDHRQPSAVLADVFLLERLGAPGADCRRQRDFTFHAQWRRCHVAPMHPA
ncbi:hypothetical protein D3C81_1784740 [compost metagenome]